MPSLFPINAIFDTAVSEHPGPVLRSFCGLGVAKTPIRGGHARSFPAASVIVEDSTHLGLIIDERQSHAACSLRLVRIARARCQGQRAHARVRAVSCRNDPSRLHAPLPAPHLPRGLRCARQVRSFPRSQRIIGRRPLVRKRATSQRCSRKSHDVIDPAAFSSLARR